MELEKYIEIWMLDQRKKGYDKWMRVHEKNDGLDRQKEKTDKHSPVTITSCTL